MQEKQRFLKMAEDKAAFEEAIKSRRTADFAALQVQCRCPLCHMCAAPILCYIDITKMVAIKVAFEEAIHGRRAARFAASVRWS